MELFPAILLISLIGGIVAIDTAAAWQIMISQPVVICPLIGWIFNQPEIGLTLGLLLELPWLVNLPCGGKHGSEGNLGAVTAAGLAVYLSANNVNTENIIVVILVLYSLSVAKLGNIGVEVVRRANLDLIHKADDAAEKGDLSRITRLNLTGILYFFIMGFVLVGTTFIVGVLILKPLIGFIHKNFDHAFGLAKYGILGVGFGGILTWFLNRETKWYFFTPVLAGMVVWILIKIF